MLHHSSGKSLRLSSDLLGRLGDGKRHRARKRFGALGRGSETLRAGGGSILLKSCRDGWIGNIYGNLGSGDGWCDVI